MDEIVSLEKVIQKFIVKNEEVIEEKSVLLSRVDTLEKENQILEVKIKELEKKASKSDELTTGKTNLDFSERQNLKSQIDDLIEKIDYHIRS